MKQIHGPNPILNKHQDRPSLQTNISLQQLKASFMPVCRSTIELWSYNGLRSRSGWLWSKSQRQAAILSMLFIGQKASAVFIDCQKSLSDRSEAEIDFLPWLSAKLKCELTIWNIVLFVHNMFELRKLVTLAVAVFSFESDFTQQVRLFATPRQLEDGVFSFVRLMCICLNLCCYFTQQVPLLVISTREKFWCICLNL